MKIIFYSPAFYTGGMENAVYNLAGLLSKEPDTEILIVYEQARTEKTEKMLNKLNTVGKVVASFEKKFECDVLINCSRKEFDLPFIKTKRTIHWFSSCLVRNQNRIQIGSKIISQSRWHQEELHKIGINSHIIGNPLNVKQIKKKADEERVSFQVPEGCRVYLIVARISGEKGFQRAIEFMQLRKTENSKLVIIGEVTSDYNEPIRQGIIRLLGNRAILLGEKDNPYPYIKKADFICCFSNHEIYGLVSEEAHILGKRVIFNHYETARDQFIEGFDYWIEEPIVERKNEIPKKYEEQNETRYQEWKKVIWA